MLTDGAIDAPDLCAAGSDRYAYRRGAFASQAAPSAINSLAILVEQGLELNPFEHAVFLFCNRQKRILKALYWDKNGFWLFEKRLEKHR